MGGKLTLLKWEESREQARRRGKASSVRKKARQGKARQGKARQRQRQGKGKARQGKARQGKEKDGRGMSLVGG